MKLSPPSFFSFVLLALVAAAPRGSDRFVGTWDVQLTPEDGSRNVKAVLTFKEGSQFSVTGQGINGFKPGQYDVDTRGVQTNAFTASVTNGKEKMEWTGMNGAGGEIRGDVKWTKSNGQVISYTYTGEKRAQ